MRHANTACNRNKGQYYGCDKPTLCDTPTPLVPTIMSGRPPPQHEKLLQSIRKPRSVCDNNNADICSTRIASRMAYSRRGSPTVFRLAQDEGPDGPQVALCCQGHDRLLGSEKEAPTVLRLPAAATTVLATSAPRRKPRPCSGCLLSSQPWHRLLEAGPDCTQAARC